MTEDRLRYDLKAGVSTEDPRLDRIKQFDERSRQFNIREQVEGKQPRSYTWRCDWWLDQGSEGACVGFAWTHELLSTPVVVRDPIPSDKDAQRFAREDVYWEAQRIDPWPGGAYPNAGSLYEGTSVLAGAKVIQNHGFIDQYRWAFSLDDAMLAVGYEGPAILGTNWYEGMWDTDDDGYISPTGAIVGGHAVLWNGIAVRYSGEDRKVDYDKSYATIHNSWGREWGEDGAGKISLTDLRRLLNEEGEVCVPVKRTK